MSIHETTPFDKIAYGKRSLVEARRQLLSASFAAILAMLAALAIPLVGVFEVGLAASLMNQLYGADLPGQGMPFNVLILSTSTVLGILAFEILHYRFPDSLPLRFMTKAAPYLLLMFFVGMAVMFMVSEIAGPEQAGPTIFTEGDVLGAQSVAEDSMLTSFAKHFGSIAIGMMVLVNLIVVHLIVSKLREKVPVILNDLHTARRKGKLSKRLINDTLLLQATRRAIEELSNVRPDEQAREAAADLEAKVLPVLQYLSRLTVTRDGAAKAKTGLFAKRPPKLPQPMPDKAVVNGFVKAVEEKLANLPGELAGLFHKG